VAKIRQSVSVASTIWKMHVAWKRASRGPTFYSVQPLRARTPNPVLLCRRTDILYRWSPLFREEAIGAVVCYCFM
jgi:hypothetical protein